MRKFIICLIAIGLLSLIFIRQLYSQNERSLKETFDYYVQSVQNEDLENLFSIVSNQQDFFFLTSNGELIDSRDGYYKFHKEWFLEDNWEMPVEFVSMNEGKDYGYTNAIFYYKSHLKDGRTYNLDSYFTLIYRKEEGIWKVAADICTPIKRYFSTDSTNLNYSIDQNYLFDIVNNRRTVRKYKNTPVPKEHIIKILDAARMCPTAGNQQPWKFLVINDREKLNLLEEKAVEWFMEKYNDGQVNPAELYKVKNTIDTLISDALSAPVYIAVLADTESKYSDYIIQDGSLAAGYLMIAARSLGYGTGFFTTFFPDEKMKFFFNIPEHYKLICFTPIGIPEEWPEMPEKKNLNELIVWNKF
jgi:nitroreductase/ketosteroid isomerase-like protein